MIYTVYKVTNNINHRYYIGVHKTSNPHDLYMGSGPIIKSALSKYGSNNFSKEILFEFDNEADAYMKEKELLEVALCDDMCYNLNEGGKGGWEYVNNLNLPNPMKDPILKRKQTNAMKKTRDANKHHYDNISRQNLQKAVEVNTGKKRPEHAKLMKDHMKSLWEDREGMRDKLSSTFTVVSPDGIKYNTNRLQEFCEEYGLTYVSVWNTSRTGKPVTKGKAKGWICYNEQH